MFSNSVEDFKYNFFFETFESREKFTISMPISMTPFLTGLGL